MRLNRRFTLLAGIGLLGVATLGAGWLWLVAEPKDVKYPTRDATLEIVGTPEINNSLFWVDNDSLLTSVFVEPIDRKNKKQRYNNSPTRLFIWNVKSDSYRDLGEIDRLYSRFCYSKGFLTYASSHTDKEVTVREGPVDRLVERKVSINEFGSEAERLRGEKRNRFNCKIYRPDAFGALANCLIPLHDGDGFLDFTGGYCSAEVQKRRREIDAGAHQLEERAALERELENKPARFLPTLSTPGLELPFKAKEVATFGGLLRFAEWSTEYVIPVYESIGPMPGNVWPKGQSRPIYLLRTDGRVSRVDMPYEDWNKGRLGGAASTRVGVLVVTGESRRLEDPDPAPAGVYRINADRLELVLQGHVGAWAESPDGCRLGVVLRRYAPGPGPWSTLRVIDLCMGSQ